MVCDFASVNAYMIKYRTKRLCLALQSRLLRQESFLDMNEDVSTSFIKKRLHFPREEQKRLCRAIGFANICCGWKVS